MLQAWLDGYRKMFCYQGRARRREFGYFLLIQFVLLLVLGFIFSRLFGGGSAVTVFFIITYIVASFLTIVPYNVRRLHDAGLSGWVCLAYIGFGALVIGGSLALPPTVGPNKYGPDPRDKAVVEEELTTVVS